MNDPSYAPSSAPRLRLQRGLAFGVIIVAALIAFEIFNYSSTVYALSDLLGELKFLGISWATILAIAFCGIDFAGIARLFTPELQSNQGPASHNDGWYLFGAWLLAATMNAMLTWWGVSLAILGHQTLGNAVVSREVLLRAVPVFVALLIWLIRILIIGTFSVAGDRLFSQADQVVPATPRPQPVISTNRTQANSLSSRSQSSQPLSNSQALARPAPRPSTNQPEPSYTNSRPEPSYHPVSASAQAGYHGTQQPITDKPVTPRTSNQYRR